jgi:hypothetical protein
VAYTPVSVQTIAAQVMALLPEDGSPVLNRIMRTMLARALEAQVKSELYFEAIDLLASEGRIGRTRGQGGKVFLARSDQLPLPLPPAEEVWTEARLMGPFGNYLTGNFHTALDLPAGSHWIVADTSAVGPRSGQWARPDFIAVSVMRFQLLPMRQVAVHSFELKTETGGTVQAVHEALAQTRFTHFGHLAWHLPSGSRAEARLPEIARQCETHGVGLIIIRNPDDQETWEVLLDPQVKDTNSAIVDAFLLSRLSPQQRDQLKQAVFGD